MTNVSAGTYPQYVCDAENRIVKIVYDSSGSNYSQFVYDGLGRCVQIVETGTTPTYNGAPSTQFVWCGNQRCEARTGTGGGTIAAQYFSFGEVIGGVRYYYTKDHLGNIREVTNSSGAVQTEYFYDPYGNVTQTQIASGTLVPSDFQYAGYYLHSRSGLNLTRTRAYMASLGRWINRDPIEEDGGVNLYGYSANNPISVIDPSGLCPPEKQPRNGDIAGGLKNMFRGMAGARPLGYEQDFAHFPFSFSTAPAGFGVIQAHGAAGNSQLTDMFGNPVYSDQYQGQIGTIATVIKACNSGVCIDGVSAAGAFAKANGVWTVGYVGEVSPIDPLNPFFTPSAILFDPNGNFVRSFSWPMLPADWNTIKSYATSDLFK